MNIVVVSEPTDSTVLLEEHAEEDYYLTMSVVMAVLCCVFGGWPSLLIAAVAICVSQNVSVRILIS